MVNIWKDFQGNGRSWFEVLSQHLLRGTVGKRGTPQSSHLGGGGVPSRKEKSVWVVNATPTFGSTALQSDVILKCIHLCAYNSPYFHISKTGTDVTHTQQFSGALVTTGHDTSRRNPPGWQLHPDTIHSHTY
jgi:hypothetical protein